MPKKHWVDIDSGKLYLGGEAIMTIEVIDKEFDVKFAPDWSAKLKR